MNEVINFPAPKQPGTIVDMGVRSMDGSFLKLGNKVIIANHPRNRVFEIKRNKSNKKNNTELDNVLILSISSIIHIPNLTYEIVGFDYKKQGDQIVAMAKILPSILTKNIPFYVEIPASFLMKVE